MRFLSQLTISVAVRPPVCVCVCVSRVSKVTLEVSPKPLKFKGRVPLTQGSLSQNVNQKDVTLGKWEEVMHGYLRIRFLFHS